MSKTSTNKEYAEIYDSLYQAVQDCEDKIIKEIITHNTIKQSDLDYLLDLAIVDYSEEDTIETLLKLGADPTARELMPY